MSYNRGKASTPIGAIRQILVTASLRCQQSIQPTCHHLCHLAHCAARRRRVHACGGPTRRSARGSSGRCCVPAPAAGRVRSARVRRRQGRVVRRPPAGHERSRAQRRGCKSGVRSRARRVAAAPPTAGSERGHRRGSEAMSAMLLRLLLTARVCSGLAPNHRATPRVSPLSGKPRRLGDDADDAVDIQSSTRRPAQRSWRTSGPQLRKQSASRSSVSSRRRGRPKSTARASSLSRIYQRAPSSRCTGRT